MSRILFFLAICTLAFYGVYSTITPNSIQSSTRASLDFESYLSGALTRNTLPLEKYDVVFFREDFVDELTTDGDISTSPSENGNTGVTKDIFIAMNTEDIASPKGNFGTPSIESQGAGYKSNCSAGLIFDPCLVIGDPIPASGGMYFGSDTI